MVWNVRTLAFKAGQERVRKAGAIRIYFRNMYLEPSSGSRMVGAANAAMGIGKQNDKSACRGTQINRPAPACTAYRVGEKGGGLYKKWRKAARHS